MCTAYARHISLVYPFDEIFPVKCINNFPLNSFFVLGPTDNLFSAHLPKNLTPSLLKTRQRFETVSAGSATTDTEDCISPLWESEDVSDI